MKIENNIDRATGLYVLGDLYPWVTGGMEIFNYYFLNNRLQQAAETIYYPGEKRTDHPGGHFIRLKKRWPARLFYPVQFFFIVAKLRKKLGYVYFSYAEESVVISFLRSLTLTLFKIPYIVTIHWGKEPAWKFRYPYIYFFKHAHAVIGVSEAICIAFKKAIPGMEFQYIPPLIPFQRSLLSKAGAKEKLGYAERERILLFVGTLKAMKNPDKIIEGFKVLGVPFLEDHHIRLIFAGQGDMENEIRRDIQLHGLNDYIRLEGLVSRERIPDYYMAADAYIISSDYEGTSLSLMEAMFNRLPIIASNAPGINGMLKHGQNALLYETKSAEQLAETMRLIFTDPLLGERLSEAACTDFKQKYSYDLMMDKYEAVFDSALF
jgi:glycosyltransferase involved in cell wall biosynthesis